MSLRQCLPGLVDEGRLSQEQADRAGGLFDELAQDFRRQFGDQAADAMATDEAIRILDREHVRRRFVAARTIEAQQRLALDLGYRDGTGGPVDPTQAAGLFTYRQGLATRNVDGVRRAIERRSFSGIAESLQRFHTDAIGRMRGVADQHDMVRELFGRDTGNLAAREMAAAWSETAETLRQRFNAAGGDIGQLRDWGLPQGHSTERVRAAGYETWRGFIAPLLDLQRMTDLSTGRPFTSESIEPALREVYDTIRTNGWNDRTPGGVGRGSVANRRSDARFLIFRDADGWLSYAERFGTNDPFHSMIGHIKGMARDIAAMERFGPNPEAGVKLARGMVEKSAAMVQDDGRALRQGNDTLAKMDSLWAEYTGANKRPAKAWLANVGGAIRSYETAKNLGSAVISAVPGDLGTQRVAAKFNGLPFTKTLSTLFQQLNPADAEARLMANRMGLIYEGWTHHASSQMRAFGDEIAAGAMGRVAETVLRVQGLGAWTDTGHAAAGMTVLGHMADVRGTAFDGLDAGFRGMMERHGLNARDWDAIRATPVQQWRGSDWLFAQDIENRDLGDRVLAMLGSEQDRAVPMNDFETRAVTNDSLRRGTALGETVKTSLLFKGFGIAMLANQGRRIMGIQGWGNRARYLASLTATMTLAGAATIQFREIANGRDPRPMDPTTPEGRAFWAAAAIQGSGFGIASDVLGLVVEPRLGSWAKYLTGPAVDSIQNVGTLGFKGAMGVGYAAGLTDKDPNFGGSLAKTLREEMPGGNLWYSRLAFQRLVSDNLSAALDPNYLRARSQMEKRARDNGSDYWWRPGELTPDRAPDVANVVN